MLILALILILLASPVYAGDWTVMDTALQVAFIGVAAVDRYQTANWDEEKYHEVGWARPFIGDHPKSGDVNRYFMLGVAAHTAIELSGNHSGSALR
jgi:hypothetical protein